MYLTKIDAIYYIQSTYNIFKRSLKNIPKTLVSFIETKKAIIKSYHFSKL